MHLSLLLAAACVDEGLMHCAVERVERGLLQTRTMLVAVVSPACADT